MTLTWEKLVLILLIAKANKGSIVGVTYRDDFDFEKRYRDVHECDPFYWHPLHLPEECADMYEKLIRSKITYEGPVRILRKERKGVRKILEEIEYEPKDYTYYSYLQPLYAEQAVVVQEPPSRRMSTYEMMLESLRTDAINQPTAPQIQSLPNVGPVAVYQQPVSKHSVGLIKKVAKAYANVDYRQPYDYYSNEKPDKDIENNDKHMNENKKEGDKNKKPGSNKKPKIHVNANNMKKFAIAIAEKSPIIVKKKINGVKTILKAKYFKS